MTTYIPRDPDNASIKATLEEIKKMRQSTSSDNRLIIGLATATLLVSIIGVIIALWK